MTWGDNTKEYATYLNLLSLASFSAAGYLASLSMWYYPSLAICHFHLYTLINNVDLNDRESCQNTFIACKYFGYLVVLSLAFGKYLADSDEDVLDFFDEVGEDLTDSDD